VVFGAMVASNPNPAFGLILAALAPPFKPITKKFGRRGGAQAFAPSRRRSLAGCFGGRSPCQRPSLRPPPPPFPCRLYTHSTPASTRHTPSLAFGAAGGDLASRPLELVTFGAIVGRLSRSSPTRSSLLPCLGRHPSRSHECSRLSRGAAFRRRPNAIERASTAVKGRSVRPRATDELLVGGGQGVCLLPSVGKGARTMGGEVRVPGGERI
jgi:hypothetical protein